MAFSGASGGSGSHSSDSPANAGVAPATDTRAPETDLRAPASDPTAPAADFASASADRVRLSGVFAPICTPFDDREDVDYDSLRFNLARYAETELLGYLALGSNGENRSLDETEKLRVLGEVVRGKAPRQVVMAGATYDAQRDAERFLHAAAGCGADLGLVLSPGYFRKQMTEDVLYRYFSTLADRSPIPLLLYNAPGFCGITLSPGLVARLATHENIVGMKDSAASGIEGFLPLEGPSFHVLAGSANFLLPAMLAGAPGGTVSLANSFPDVAVRLWRYGVAGDEEHGAPYQAWVSRVNAAISGSYGVPGVKAAMDLAGFRGGIPRRPLLPLEQRDKAALREFLLAEGLLP